MLRLVLKEKRLNFELIEEKYWERRTDFLKLNPAGQTPIIVDNGTVIAGTYALFEYLEEYKDHNNALSTNIKLIGNSKVESAKIRYLVEWFSYKFYNEVTKYILFEKIIKLITNAGSPNSNPIVAAKKNLLYHISYMEYLLSDNTYLADEKITLADYAAAAQISILDLVSDMSWQSAKIKEWYALIKSRPSFRAIFDDKIVGINPPQHYSNPDF